MEEEIFILIVPVYIGPYNIASPLGFTAQENWQALLNGELAISPKMLPFSETPLCTAQIDNTKLRKAFSSDKYTRLEKLCILSIQDVLKQNKLSLSDKSTLLVISTTKGNIDVLEGSTNFPKQRAHLTEMANAVGNYFRCANMPLIVSNACISGLLSMVIAKRYIAAGMYKNVIVCGADVISEFTLSGFKSFNALSDEPCKPFDKNRKGINLGEAAATVLLSADTISNVIIRAGASANDANHISGPSRTGEGLLQAIQHTMSQVSDTKIDFISAHGTATEYNDEMEAVAFTRAGFGDIPLHSLKGYYGHTLGAAGVLESIIAIESLKQHALIPSAGFSEQGTSEKLNIITKAESNELSVCLKTASGFGGCNAAAIFEKI